MIGLEIYRKFLQKYCGQRMPFCPPFPPSPFRQRDINRIQAVRQEAQTSLSPTPLHAPDN